MGLPSSAGGNFVSGASMANLTALIVARDQMLGEDMMRRERAVIYVSAETHFCVRKALRNIGFSNRNIRTIEPDLNFCMDTAQLSKMIDQDLNSGNSPFVIVGTCGTTKTGSIDPLEELAEIASKHNIWLHVDAAYGGSLAISKTHKSLVAGLRHAKSISWDAHKWLFQVHGCGVVLFREKRFPLKSFAASSDILVSIEDSDTDLDPWNYGIELTRPARHMPLWFSLQCMGLHKVDAMISRGIYLAEMMETELKSLPHWRIMSSARLGVITFRYIPKHASDPESDLLNSLISKKLEVQNTALILTIRLRGSVSLRMCTINPRTQDHEIRQVVKALDQAAREFEQNLPSGTAN
jgi:glutamate/tyrosine decarboxylase-like PLP-dependent enzyme